MARHQSDPNIMPPGGSTDLPPNADDDAEVLADAIRVSAEPQTVPVNMYETDDAIVLVAPLPGVMADDVQITVDRDSVAIWAECRTLAPKAYLRHEWHYGPYEREVDLPPGFEGDAFASFGNGQLALRIGRGGQRLSPIVVLPAG